MNDRDREYMRRAIGLALQGEGWVHPNPLVGAVIVSGDRIIGEGYHRKYGELHAERNAIASLTEPAKGATMYVTLEPCCHYGKTPPCTEAIIENEIGRVVIGSRDPNPKVAGKGAEILRQAGVEVVEDFLREECDAINDIFFHYITTKRPYVIMKYAMTADGKIATKTGKSKWITGEAARGEVQKLRNRCMGIMAGIGTVLQDDPELTCRLEGGRSPVRIICDSRLRIPEEAQIVKTAGEYETILACALPEWQKGEMGPDDLPKEGDQTAKAHRLIRAGVKLVNLPQAGESGNGDSRAVDLPRLMDHMGERGIDSILLEGGGRLNDSALRAGLIHEVHAFVAPKIFGGTARSPVEGEGVEEVDQGLAMKLIEAEPIGEDIRLIYRVDRNDDPEER